MKATLRFDLEDKDQRLSLQRALKATEAYIVLREFDDLLRSEVKYNNELSEEVRDKVQELRDKFGELLRDRSVDIFEELP